MGILILVIAIPTNTNKEIKSNYTEKKSTQSNQQDYQMQMEVELESLLSHVRGVGEVKVMITLKSSEKQIVEKDSNTNDEKMEENTVFAENSDGSQIPYVRQTDYPRVEGVLVVAEHGDNAIVVEEIKEGVQALFDVDMHKIKIMKGMFE